ncbi:MULTISPECIES: ABC transporter permease [Catenuloplanes]|uniref:ABC-2 type transport system permease protein n=1 Tax=Catenuloplanes niger TaxID=587534 RepID=A0AAE3ZZ90_9ACTN|nr:ABC transporter permease [Catenuloplanes niger]MDR7327692.1 ABC-2 type transport system permease protein [Catenuloplanes niger]
MYPIAYSEFTQIFRNRAVLISTLMPLAVSAFFIYRRDTFTALGGTGYVAATLAFTIAAFSLYTTAVTTLAARRQDLFLKRLRSTTAGDAAILSGLTLPVAVTALVQVGAVLGVFAAVTGGPADPVLLTGAILLAFLTMLALAMATAGLTGSPEQAQVTTLPISLTTIGVASWVGITGTEDLAALKRALPGGAAAELIINAWNGGVPLTGSLPLLVPALGWVVLAAVLALRLFRWEPRR